jgi:RNA polymerase sigma-70 factor, ECF subfamily
MVLTGNRDDANELVQAACLHALEKAHLFDPGTYLDHCFFRMTQRLWCNDRRKLAVRQSGGFVSVDEIDIPDPRPGPDLNILARQVFNHVMELPEAQRIAVLLVYVEEFSYNAAAELLDIPISTVMSRLAAARQKLSKHVSPEGKTG